MIRNTNAIAFVLVNNALVIWSMIGDAFLRANLNGEYTLSNEREEIVILNISQTK